MSDKSELLVICVNQMVRPKIKMSLDGVGDCTECVADEENKNCKNFRAVRLSVFSV